MNDFARILPSPIDHRDRIAKLSQLELPSHVDLIPDVEEVENQMQTGSCTANAAASALEIAYKRAGRSKDFSRLYNYWYSRLIGNIKGDNGAYPRDVCKALNKHGICLESTWKFDVQKNLNVEPSVDAQTEAKEYPVHEYARLESEDIVTEIKKSVALGIPVMTSIRVSKEFNSLESNWKTHDWNQNVDESGSHQVLIIGYNDEAKRFLAQNSWGSIWGDGGFFGIPYEKIGLDYNDKSKSAYEYWILTVLNVVYFPADGRETKPFNLIESNEAKGKKIEKIFGIAFLAVTLLLYFLMK